MTKIEVNASVFDFFVMGSFIPLNLKNNNIYKNSIIKSIKIAYKMHKNNIKNANFGSSYFHRWGSALSSASHRAQDGPPRSRRPFYRRIRARAQTKAFFKEIIFHLEKNWIFHSADLGWPRPTCISETIAFQINLNIHYFRLAHDESNEPKISFIAWT